MRVVHGFLNGTTLADYINAPTAFAGAIRQLLQILHIGALPGSHVVDMAHIYIKVRSQAEPSEDKRQDTYEHYDPLFLFQPDIPYPIQQGSMGALL